MKDKTLTLACASSNLASPAKKKKPYKYWNINILYGFFLFNVNSWGETSKSIEDAMPWVNISRPEAIEQAAKLGGRLLDGPEWAAICEECAETEWTI